MALANSQTSGSAVSGGVDLSQPGGWAQATLVAIGAPSDPGTDAGKRNISFLEAWKKAEGTAAAYNPLATTLTAPGSSDFNTTGVQNYATANDGIAATAKTLLAGYPHIVGTLRAADPGAISSNTGIWADLNRWVSGKSSPTDSAYVQTISKIFFGEKGANDWTSFDIADAGKAAEGAAKKVADATGLSALATIAAAFVKAVGELLNPNTWRRAGLALLGVLMMLAGGWILAKGAGVAPSVVPIPV